MKTIIYLTLTLVALIALYVGAIFAGFDLPKPAFMDKGIEGNAELKVTLLMNNNVKNPLPNIEVDLATKPGQPPQGGVAMTDGQGIATFKVKPGSYYIYFNDLSFPQNLEAPEPQSINVIAGVVNEKTLLIDSSK